MTTSVDRTSTSFAFTQRVLLLAIFLLPLVLTTPLMAQSQQQQWKTEYEKTLVHVRNRNIDKWLSEVQIIANKGNIIAANQLGRLYYSGSQELGINTDPGQSFSWYKKSADGNDPQGQYAMGSFYETGTYVEQSSELAIRWYTKSALQGYEMANVQLAAIYLYGSITESDVPEALNWIQKVYSNYPEEENLNNPYYFLGRYFQDKQELFNAADFYIAGIQPPSFEDLQIFEASLGEIIDTGNKADVLAMADFYRLYLEMEQPMMRGMRDHFYEQAIFWYQEGAALGDLTAMREGLALAKQQDNATDVQAFTQMLVERGDKQTLDDIINRHILFEDFDKAEQWFLKIPGAESDTELIDDFADRLSEAEDYERSRNWYLKLLNNEDFDTAVSGLARVNTDQYLDHGDWVPFDIQSEEATKVYYRPESVLHFTFNGNAYVLAFVVPDEFLYQGIGLNNLTNCSTGEFQYKIDDVFGFYDEETLNKIHPIKPAIEEEVNMQNLCK